MCRMKIDLIDNNQTNFGAFQFKSLKAKQKFITTLKRQSLVDFNESMNVLKAQGDNFVNICIKQQAKNKQRPDTLNLCAEVDYDEIVNAENSLVEFLKTCAKIADSKKIQWLEFSIKNGSISKTTAKKDIFKMAIINYLETRPAGPDITLSCWDI